MGSHALSRPQTGSGRFSVDPGGNLQVVRAFWLLQKGNVAKIQVFLGVEPGVMPLVWFQQVPMGSGESLAHCFALQSWWERSSLLVY